MSVIFLGVLDEPFANLVSDESYVEGCGGRTSLLEMDDPSRAATPLCSEVDDSTQVSKRLLSVNHRF